jgi:hypothetical protein
MTPPVVAPVEVPWAAVAARRRRWPWLAAGAVAIIAALAALGQALFRDSEEVAHPDSTTKLNAAGDTSNAAHPSAAGPGDETSERRALDWLLKVGCEPEVFVGEERVIVRSPEDIPRGPFRLAQAGLGDRPGVNDEGLKNLRGCAQLEELALWNTALTDTGLRNLGRLAALRGLYLSGTAVTGRGLDSFPGLSRLEMSGTAVDDTSVEYLRAIAGLEVLDLSDTKIGDQAIEVLVQLKRLKELNVERTKVTPAGATRLRAALPDCKVMVNGRN